MGSIFVEKDGSSVEIFNDAKNISIWEAKGWSVKAGQAPSLVDPVEKPAEKPVIIPVKKSARKS